MSLGVQFYIPKLAAIAELLVRDLERLRDTTTKADVRSACELALRDIATEFAHADTPREPATPSDRIPGHEQF